MSKVKSIRGNNCANVFTPGRFTMVVPVTACSDAGQSLVDFTDDVGIPKHLVTDGAGEFTGKGKQFVRERRVACRYIYTPANRVGRTRIMQRSARLGFLQINVNSKCRRKGYQSGSGI